MANHHASEVLGGNDAQIKATFGVRAGHAPLRPMLPIPLRQTGQVDVVLNPGGQSRYSRDISVGPGEFASPSGQLPEIRTGQLIVVTQSLASALAVEHATGHTALAAIDAINLRHLAVALKGADCNVTIVPDNFDLSRAAARDAARATGAKLADPQYKPGQHNLLSSLSEAFSGIRERFPMELDPNRVAQTLANPSERMTAEQAALVDLVAGPISDAKPWTPGMGLAERITQVSRAISTGAEIGR